MSQVVLIERPLRGFSQRGLEPTVSSSQPVHFAVRRGTRSIEDGIWVESIEAPADPSMSFAGLLACSLSTFVVVTIGVLTALGALPVLAGYRPVAVASGSMSPTLNRTDIVVTEQPAGPLAVGTVIDFGVDESANRIHRIVEVLPEGYRTKGDGNQTPDSEIVAPANVRGFGVLVVPIVGSVALWADEGKWLRVGLALMSLGAVAWLAIPGHYDDLFSGRRGVGRSR